MKFRLKKNCSLSINHSVKLNQLTIYESIDKLDLKCKTITCLVTAVQTSVCLLTDMAEPIQQITSNNEGRHQREHISYTLQARKEKVTTGDTAC